MRAIRHISKKVRGSQRMKKAHSRNTRARTHRHRYKCLWIFLQVLLLVTIVARAFAADPPSANVPTLLLGSAWYPEQWPESRWDKDLALMEAAHMHVGRVGEFAWSRMEPGEGHYDLDWLDRAVRLAEKHHIAVV